MTKGETLLMEVEINSLCMQFCEQFQKPRERPTQSATRHHHSP
jgi:hypothetical protein